MKKCSEFVRTRPKYIWLSWIMFALFCFELAAWPYWFIMKKRTILQWLKAGYSLFFAYAVPWIPGFLVLEWSIQSDSVILVTVSVLFLYFCGVIATLLYSLLRGKILGLTEQEQ